MTLLAPELIELPIILSLKCFIVKNLKTYVIPIIYYIGITLPLIPLQFVIKQVLKINQKIKVKLQKLRYIIYLL